MTPFPRIKKISFFVLLCLLTRLTNLQAQNVVPNGDFEEITGCPSALSDLYLAAPWFNATFATADLFHSCAPEGDVDVPENFIGSQMPQSGEGYAGVFVAQTGGPPYREFMETPLSEPLIANHPYLLEWYVSVADLSSCMPLKICAYICTDSIAEYTSTNYFYGLSYIEHFFCNNDDMVFNELNTWVKLSACFIATGKEKYLVIGNNYSNTFAGCTTENPSYQTSYFYVDNISIAPMEYQRVYFDTTVCKGSDVTIDAAQLISEPDNTTPEFVWNNGSIGSKKTLTEDGNYYVLVKNGCVTDTVFIQINYITDCPEIFYIPNAFSPNMDGLNDRFRITDENITISEFNIYNRYGAQVFSISDYHDGWDGTINGIPAETGVYIYYLKYFTNITETYHEKKGYITLLR